MALRNKYTTPSPPNNLLARVDLYKQLTVKRDEIERLKILVKQAEEQHELIRAKLEENAPKVKKVVSSLPDSKWRAPLV